MSPAATGRVPAGLAAVVLDVDGHAVRISNPHRPYFSARGETKLDLAHYYLAVGPGIVNALRERPCMLHRFPDGVDVLARNGEAGGPQGEQRDVLIVGVGAMCVTALEVSERLAAHGVSSTVLDPRWVLPVADSVVRTAARHRIVVVIEDGVRAGGIGSLIRQQMRAQGVDTALNEVGLPTEFLEHASRDQILEHTGVTAQRIAQDTLASVLGTRVPYARPAHDDAAARVSSSGPEPR